MDSNKGTTSSAAVDNTARSTQPSAIEPKEQEIVTVGAMREEHDSEEQCDEDVFSIVSVTSTVEYGQEPFDSFQAKAKQLIIELFPGHTERDMTLERMGGGAFNRIIGVTLSGPQSHRPWYSIENIRRTLSSCVRGRPQHQRKNQKYILRIPRDSAHDLFHQVTTLAYLKDNFAYPVPSVVLFDSTEDNALGKSFMLQKRLAGQPLIELWTSLSQEQRKSAARCIAEVVRDMHKVKHRCAGIISARNTLHDLTTGFLRIEPVPVEPIGAGGDIFSTPLATPQTTRNFLLSLIERQRKHTETIRNPMFDHVWDGFIEITNKLADTGFVPDTDSFHLYHADFQSRNLLFAVTSPTSVRLTGVMDWDSAFFAPKFMSTRAPFFLWSGDDADELDEGGAVIDPTDSGKLELKRVFEDVVGEAFYRDSYRREYVLARRMLYFLVKGIRSGGDLFLCEEILEEWAARNSETAETD
ncbi:hypothetical protein FB567DRAFT_615273 [Paraphoma chrysanthemicola]|uniref:Aminoglycoside phosphotransferase domain-containing protein n=1 Tax=Paraphoma chrysanthemicola TaxID=798071 RepID=A0A8K0QSJ0_9PLEO|nr:hypothetical protein FB567DRAFT_615273 [Paraphoma chrysanthemicola]